MIKSHDLLFLSSVGQRVDFDLDDARLNRICCSRNIINSGTDMLCSLDLGLAGR